MDRVEGLWKCNGILLRIERLKVRPIEAEYIDKCMPSAIVATVCMITRADGVDTDPIKSFPSTDLSTIRRVVGMRGEVLHSVMPKRKYQLLCSSLRESNRALCIISYWDTYWNTIVDERVCNA